MKQFKSHYRNTFILAVIIGIVAFVSCEGPAGPAGVDAETTCVKCHNQANFDLKSVEYEMSGHAAGGAVGYAGGRNGCAKCHSHEGFVETLHTGRDTTAANVPIPTRVDCATCHDSHVSFDTIDGPDYALRTTESFAMMFNPDIVFDVEGSSNLCASCHQPRTPAPTDDGSGTFKISSPHYGPHHGPQATYMMGVGAYEFDGSEEYPEVASSSHYKAGCTSCHMAEPEGDHGGHTFSASVNGCTECHTSANSLDINSIQSDVEGKLEQLAALLKTKGVIDDEGHPIIGTYDIELVGAFFNYIGVEEDRSKGVHNPAYIKALLENTIDAID